MSNEYLKLIQLLGNTKYIKWYINIILKALNRFDHTLSIGKLRKQAKLKFNYIEAHHILPKWLCTDYQKKDKNNLVILTAKEHFIVHHLLTKIYPGSASFYALARFKYRGVKESRSLTSNQFEIARKFQAKAASISMKGNKHSLGKNTGPCSSTRRNNISYGRLKTTKQLCQYCNKSFDPGNFKKYHGNNCKQNSNHNNEVWDRYTLIAKKSIKNQIETGSFSKPKRILGSFTCPHCNKTGTNYGAMQRFHFNNCSLITGKKHKRLPLIKCSCIICHKETDIANLLRHRCKN